ncbi:hypothetical protein OUZ56_033610 [Daphnia magna]|uniref:Uncharacterized protein n=1 Tax=Daphnia magna TaxID=35525 RepID=A0ABR0BAX2_9CRUS|nr:hypothetical protein OUZ56_033610 [Daphnia magna]
MSQTKPWKNGCFASTLKQSKQRIPLKQLFQNENIIFHGQKTNVLSTHSFQDCSNSSAADTNSVQDYFNISAADTSIDSFVNSASPYPLWICGYLMKTRDSVWKDCDACKNGLITKYEDLPLDFVSAEYTASRNYGGATRIVKETLDDEALWAKPTQ